MITLVEALVPSVVLAAMSFPAAAKPLVLVSPGVSYGTAAQAGAEAALLLTPWYTKGPGLGIVAGTHLHRSYIEGELTLPIRYVSTIGVGRFRDHRSRVDGKQYTLAVAPFFLFPYIRIYKTEKSEFEAGIMIKIPIPIFGQGFTFCPGKVDNCYSKSERPSRK